MKTLVAIGEALIDFAPQQTGGQIKDTEAFLPKVGGAPANVCGAYAKLGGNAIMLTQLGTDPFGDKIVEELTQSGIDTTYISRTDEANTSLAFVALLENGDREFSFFRKPGADMLYQPEQVPDEVFFDAYALHFCSVSLGNYPMKQAHKKAIEKALAAGAMISFDPNLRPQLWEDETKLKEAVTEFLPYADILKLSDEELFFITGKEHIEDAIDELFDMGISVILYTKGSLGAEIYTKTARASVAGNGKKAVDTTGAGDGFIGSFLSQLAYDGRTLEDMMTMTAEEWKAYLDFSNRYCGESIQKKGALSSYITRQEMEKLNDGK